MTDDRRPDPPQGPPTDGEPTGGATVFAAPPPEAPVVAADDVDERDARALRAPTRRAGSKVWTVIGVLALLAVAGVGYGWFWLQSELDPSGPPGAEVVVDVPDGATAASIGDLLETQGVVPNGTVFEYYVKYRNVDTADWQAGPHVFKENMSVDEAIAVLDTGPGSDAIPVVTIPEGFSVFASGGLPAAGPVVKRIADPQDGIEGITERDVMAVLLSNEVRSKYQPRGQKSLEGLLFPETYRLEEGEGAKALIAKMVEQMDTVLDDLGYQQANQRLRQATGLDLSPYEVVIVASLIERETLVAAERPMVARVIYNRLAASNPLGIDATTVYALGRPIETQADIDIDSPYNTRNRQGLPPTPIAVPGRASLQAALEPAQGDWFYYVLEDAEGNHFFTADENEFINKANECRDKGLC